jgi:Icc-related predicted phosphoesterase
LSVEHPNVIACYLNEHLTPCNDDNPQQTRTLTEGDAIIVAGDITRELVPCRLGRSYVRVCVISALENLIRTYADDEQA